MRQKRAKVYRKLMSLYSMTFGFRTPYQVLVDSVICKETVSHKIDLAELLKEVLQGPVKVMITQCCIHELYLQGKEVQPVVDVAKTYERRNCNHKEAIAGDECLLSVIGDSNKHRYVIATQSQPLRHRLRQIPGVPIIHTNRSVLVLEPPSDVTLLAKNNMENARQMPSESEKKGNLVAESSATISQQNNAQKPKKKRGPKGPNPLSVKKKKPKFKNIDFKRKERSTDLANKEDKEARKGFAMVDKISSVEKAGKRRRFNQDDHVGNEVDSVDQESRKKRKLEVPKT